MCLVPLIAVWCCHNTQVGFIFLVIHFYCILPKPLFPVKWGQNIWAFIKNRLRSAHLPEWINHPSPSCLKPWGKSWSVQGLRPSTRCQSPALSSSPGLPGFCYRRSHPRKAHWYHLTDRGLSAFSLLSQGSGWLWPPSPPSSAESKQISEAFWGTLRTEEQLRNALQREWPPCYMVILPVLMEALRMALPWWP